MVCRQGHHSVVTGGRVLKQVGLFLFKDGERGTQTWVSDFQELSCSGSTANALAKVFNPDQMVCVSVGQELLRLGCTRRVPGVY